MTRAERIITFIETYLVIPEGSRVGEPFQLEEFQKKFIVDVYDNPHGTRHAYLSIGRKNGKTGLIAALLLAHIIGPEAIENSQIVSGAMTREQASLVYNLASKIVKISPNVQGLIQLIPSRKTMIGLSMNVEYKAIASEGSSAMGLSPVLVILDEIGQITSPTSAFVDALTSSQGAHQQPLLIAISTQAATDNDLFSIWLDDAKSTDNQHVVSHVYQADAECDLDDRKQWAKANPALGIFRSLVDVEEQAARAKRMPANESSFRNLILNQRVSRDNYFVTQEIWKASSGEPAPLNPDIPCQAGLDLSMRTDLTALVIRQVIDGQSNIHCYVWTPKDTLLDRAKRDRTPYDAWARNGWLRTVPGSTVDLAYVAQEIVDIVKPRNLEAILYDRWRIDQLKHEFDRLEADIPLTPHGQGYKDMSPSMDALEEDLLKGNLNHGGNPALTKAIMSARILHDPSGNRKMDKSKYNKRIDPAVALVMSYKTINNEDDQGLSEDDIDEFLANSIG